jgi:thiol-disulfide isomerase/thioredoxin
MSKNILLVSLLSLALLAATFFSDQGVFDRGLHDNAPLPKPELGQAVPDFKFYTWQDDPYRLTEFRGKTILVHFWASWCAPCLTEFPALIDFAKTHQDDVVVIALSLDKDNTRIKRFLGSQMDTLPPHFYVGIDRDQTISHDVMGTFKLPETYVISPDGVLKQKIEGVKDWSDPKTSQDIF